MWRRLGIGLFFASGAVASWSCSSSSDAGSSADGGVGPDGAGGGVSGDDGGAPGAPAGVASKAKAITAKLGASHADHFLVGLGDDAAYTLGPALDIRYAYLSSGWPAWNHNPDYLGFRVQEAQSHGMIFMATYYCMADAGDGNVAGSIQSSDYMKVWWQDFAQLLSSIHQQGQPVLVHMEPDFWGYLERDALTSGGAANVSAAVAVGGNSECTSEPENIIGFTHCILAMARARAPEAIVGLHASIWGSNMDVGINTDPSFDVVGEANKTVDFFKSVGGDQADFIVTDMLDRDAGCYEVGYNDPDSGKPICPDDPTTPRYWDETNQTLPNFKQEQTWIGAVGSGLNLPVAWWQIPLGVPSGSAGTPTHFRDNRVHYMFGHIDEYVGAGGFLAAFGAGAGYQTGVGTDNDQFKNAAAGYYAKPFTLP